MLKIFINNKKGVSLLELIVAVSLFSIIILAASALFQSVVSSQRKAIASQNLQNSIQYVFEAISKEIRMARRDDGTCGSTDVYSVVSSQLSFMNQYGECVSYFLEDDVNGVSRLKVYRDGNYAYVTPDEVDVKKLEFALGATSNQPYVTIFMNIESLKSDSVSDDLKIQTTISSRLYE